MTPKFNVGDRARSDAIGITVEILGHIISSNGHRCYRVRHEGSGREDLYGWSYVDDFFHLVEPPREIPPRKRALDLG